MSEDVSAAQAVSPMRQDKNEIDKYGKEALEKSIGDALSQL